MKTESKSEIKDKKSGKTLQLERETLRELTEEEAGKVQGGGTKAPSGGTACAPR